MTRSVHEETLGFELTEDQRTLQRRLLNIEAHAQRAEVELRTLLEEQTDRKLARPPMLMEERLRTLVVWLAGMQDARKGAGL